MQIDKKQLAGSPRTVGKRGGHDVVELATKGGLHLVVVRKDAGFETLGTGPHPGVARFIAKKRAPDIHWSALAKADWVDEAVVEHLLPKYEAITDRCRRLGR